MKWLRWFENFFDRLWDSWTRPKLSPDDKVFYDLETGVENDEKNPEYIIVLVHGTQFGRIPKEGVQWTRPGSPLWRMLCASMKGKVTLINRFRWSGWNTFTSRFIARNKLLHLLVHIRRNWPTTPVFLIGHSHGGNIISSAALESFNIAGIVCLATPFLCVERRKLHSIYKHSLPIIGWALGIILLFASGIYLLSLDLTEKFIDTIGKSMGVATVFALTIGVGCSLAIFVGPFLYIAIVLLRILHSVTRLQIFDMTRPPRIDHSKVLFVRGIGDEASFAISVAHMAGRLLDLATNIVLSLSWIGISIARGMKYLEQFNKAIQMLAVITFTLITPFLLLVLQEVVPWTEPFVKTCFILVYTLCTMLPTLSLIAVTSWTVGGIILSFALGPEMLLIGPTLRIAVESSPSGCWNVATFKRSPNKEGSSTMMAHSHVYGNERVLAYIRRWLASRI